MSVNAEIREPSTEEVVAAVLRIFTRDQIRDLSPIPFRGFVAMVARRLAKAGPPPTDDELEGLRELAFEHLWHPAFESHTPKNRSDGGK